MLWHESLQIKVTPSCLIFMVFAEDIRKTILKLAEERGPDQTFESAEVVERVKGETSNDLLEQVRFVASVLVKEGKITATPSGGEEPIRLYRLNKAG